MSMKVGSTLLLSFLLLGMVELGYGQKLNFKNYSVNDGLPQAQVHDIAQTKDGYIWMATYGGGLAKFDGQEFVTYTTEDGLKDNSVEDVIVDSQDNIWVSTSRGGVATFRKDSLVYPFQDDSLYHHALTALDEFGGTMWFGPYQRGAIYQDGDSLITLTTKDGLPSNTVWDFHQDSTGNIWMSTSKGVSIYDGESFTNYSMEDGVSGQTVYRIVEVKNGYKWMATSNGVSIWKGNSFESITSINGNSLGAVYDIVQASDGRIWIGTQTNGIYIYDGTDFQHITVTNGLSSNYVYDLYKDQNNHIWIGTDEDGVNLYHGEGFLRYTEENGLHSNSVLSVYKEENEALWVGTTNGIASFDGQTFNRHPLPGQYHNQYIWNITGLPNGDKLIGMPDSTLMRFDGETYTNFSNQFDLEKLYIYDLLVDSEGHLWICTRSGLYDISLRTKEVRHYTTDDGLADNRVFHIYEGDSGKKWIGTFFGLNIFDGENFKTVRVDDGLGHNKVHYVTQDERGDIWLGTGGGVSVYQPKTDGNPAEIHNFDREDGMELVNTHFIWFDEQGYLWQGTNGGIQMLDVPTYRKTGNMPITHHSLSNSGIGLEFNYHALASNSSGEAWMGSMSGVVRLNASQFERETSPIKLDLTQITMNSLPVEWQNYQDSLIYNNGALNFPSITFPYGENVYGFSYRGLSYTHPENVEYRYKLMGFDKNWMPATQNNSAVYTNLSPGDYTFMVQAKKSGGDFTNTTLSYDFSVAYPFWRTYWFYGFAAIALTGLIYGYIRIRVGYLEKNRLQELVDEQTRDLREALKEKEVLIKEIHHRVKNNLAVISGLLELQVDHADDRFASKILRNSQQRVQSISMIHEKLYRNDRLAEIDFSQYIKELIEVINQSNRQVDKDIEVEISTGDVKLGVDQGIPCGLIINELLSNAYEHAFEGREKGKIVVQFEETSNSKVRLSVKDDGVGLPEDFGTEDSESKSLGMVLVKTLTTQLEGDFNYDRLNRGTLFTVEFEKAEPQLQVPVND